MLDDITRPFPTIYWAYMYAYIPRLRLELIHVNNKGSDLVSSQTLHRELQPKPSIDMTHTYFDSDFKHQSLYTLSVM